MDKMDELTGSYLPINSIFDLDKIEHGDYGSTYSAKFKDRTVTLKVICDQTVISDREKALFVTIAKRMRTFPQKCDAFVKSCGVLMKPRWFCIATEYLDHGNMAKFLARYYIPYPMYVRIWRDIVKGMNFLHNQDLLHLDLKCSNVLLTKDYRGKLCDYGLVEWKTLRGSYIFGEKPKNAPESPPVKKTLQDVTHIPPDIWHDLYSPVTKAFDVYGFGLLMWHTIVRRHPYEKLPIEGKTPTADVVIEMVKKGERPDLKYMFEMPPETVSMMKQCWSQEKEDRPSFSDVGAIVDKIYKKIKPDIQAAVNKVNSIVNPTPYNYRPSFQSEFRRGNEQRKYDGKGDDKNRELAELLIQAVQEQSRGEHEGEKKPFSYRHPLRHLHPLLDMFSPRSRRGNLPGPSAGRMPEPSKSSSEETPMQLGFTNPQPTGQPKTSSSTADSEQSSSTASSSTSQNEEPMDVESKHPSEKKAGRQDSPTASTSSSSMSAPTHQVPSTSSNLQHMIPSDEPISLPQTSQTLSSSAATSVPSPPSVVQPTSSAADLEAHHIVPSNSSESRGPPQAQSENNSTTSGATPTQEKGNTFHDVNPGPSSSSDKSPRIVTYTENGNVRAVHVQGMQNFHIGPTTETHVHSTSYTAPPTPSTSNINSMYNITDSDDPISDVDVIKVANHLPLGHENWRRLAETLGFNRADIDMLNSDYNIDGEFEKGYQTVRKWKMENGKRASLRLLAQALVSLDLPEVAVRLQPW